MALKEFLTKINKICRINNISMNTKRHTDDEHIHFSIVVIILK